MSPYTSALLALRHSGRWMSFIEPMPDGLARRVLSVLAYARYLCPNAEPSGHYDNHTVTLTWHWGTKVLTIRIPQCHPNVFDESEEDEPIIATFMDGDTGEFWREEIQPGTGTMPPVFPPRLEWQLLDKHKHTVENPQPKRDRLYTLDFRIKRLFPDLPFSVTQVEEQKPSFGQRIRQASSGLRPFVEDMVVLGVRTLVRELPNIWRNRHVKARTHR